MPSNALLLYSTVFPNICEHSWKSVSQAPPAEHPPSPRSSARAAAGSLPGLVRGTASTAGCSSTAAVSLLHTNSYALQWEEVVITNIKLFLFSGSFNTHVINEEFSKERLQIQKNIKRPFFEVNEQSAATAYSTAEKSGYMSRQEENSLHPKRNAQQNSVFKPERRQRNSEGGIKNEYCADKLLPGRTTSS